MSNTIRLTLVFAAQAIVAGATLAGGGDADRSTQHVLPDMAAEEAAEAQSATNEVAQKNYILEPSPLEALSSHDGVNNGQPRYALNIPPGDEVAERRVIQELAGQVMLKAPKQIDALEETLTGYLKANARTASGASKLAIFLEKFDAKHSPNFAHRHMQDFILAAVSEWEQRHPRSSITPVLKAIMYKNMAMTGSVNSLGSDSISSTVDYGSYISKAIAALEAAPHAADANPTWHEEMIEVRAMQAANVDEVISFAKQAATKFPEYAFTAAASSVLYVSNDPARDVESLAVALSEKAPDGSRDERYIRYYMAILFSKGLPAFQLLNINPDRFASGAREMAAKYPIEFVHQRLALMSCVLADKGTARHVWKEIRQRPIQSIWGQPEFFNLCLAWNAEPEQPARPKDDSFEKREFKQREIEN